MGHRPLRFGIWPASRAIVIYFCQYCYSPRRDKRHWGQPSELPNMTKWYHSSVALLGQKSPRLIFPPSASPPPPHQPVHFNDIENCKQRSGATAARLPRMSEHLPPSQTRQMTSSLGEQQLEMACLPHRQTHHPRTRTQPASNAEQSQLRGPVLQ